MKFILEPIPVKHRAYSVSQQFSDKTACVSCTWQADGILAKADAVFEHDQAANKTHNCDEWEADSNGICPCGKTTEAARDLIKAEALEEFRNKLVSGHYALNFTSAEDLFAHIAHLLERDANLLRG